MSCSLKACGITESGRVPSREGVILNFVHLVLFDYRDLLKRHNSSTVGFLKLLSTCLGNFCKLNK